jgi:hypothetical protein
VADAPELQRDRDLARDHPDDGDGDGVGRDSLEPVAEVLGVLALGDIDAAGAAADDDAGPRLPRRSPASLQASDAAMTAMSDAFE